MSIDQELKDAISILSHKDKDKLIFRLLKKDEMLTKQLIFDLVSMKTVEERRDEVQKFLEQQIEQISNAYYSIGYLHQDIRYMSGTITEHVKITKDKYGEVYLNLWMLTEVLERNNQKILSVSVMRAEKFCVAVAARAFKIILLINKMHEDYGVDFVDGLQKLGRIIGNNPYLMKYAMKHGLDVNWLIKNEIPRNIDEIYKNIRSAGYLR
jgi:hypothetical protein